MGMTTRERKYARLHLMGERQNKQNLGVVMSVLSPATLSVSSDAELANRICRGDQAAFEILMRQYNQRLFRVVRGILKNDADAEEALQDAYLSAYRAFAKFRGDSMLSTWLTRIVINEALGRLRKQRREQVVIAFRPDNHAKRRFEDAAETDAPSGSPEEAMVRAELRALIEKKIDELPIGFRTVFMMREVEEMTVEETSQCLGIPEATVGTRLFRAKGLLRAALEQEIGVAIQDAFSFAGGRCDRIVAAVMKRISTHSNP
jgi:RNA polymerase sigma-70 factor (ECF subfamily)